MSHFHRVVDAICISLCCAALLGGCAARIQPDDAGLREQPRLAHMLDVEDVRRLPQDLTVYARSAGKTRRLLSEQEQMRQDARFIRIFFSPWKQSAPSAPAGALARRFGKGPRGFTETGMPWTREEWNHVRRNAQLDAYPLMAHPAITIHHTFMRELPTLHARMTGRRPFGADNPFDMLQYSSLFIGTPIYVTHISADALWYFVESPIASGWTPVKDVALADAAFMSLYRTARYVAIIRDDLPLAAGAGVIGRTHIGAIYPLQEENPRGLRVFTPASGPQGQAVPAAVELEPDQARIMPLPLNPGWLARLGNQMMGQPYGWGGLHSWRDCSSTMRDLFAPFGIWLPRNSTAQSKNGDFIPMDGMDGMDKERLIRERGAPFISLLWMRGHIMLYLGRHQNENVVFHNIWGLRPAADEDGDARHVLGRAVVSSLRPGLELPIKQGSSLLERLRAMVVLPKYAPDAP